MCVCWITLYSGVLLCVVKFLVVDISMAIGALWLILAFSTIHWQHCCVFGGLYVLLGLYTLWISRRWIFLWLRAHYGNFLFIVMITSTMVIWFVLPNVKIYGYGDTPIW